MTKSIDRVRLGAIGRSSGRRSVASPLRRRLRFYTQAIKLIDAVNPLVVNAKTFTSQKLPDTPVTKTAAFSASSVMRRTAARQQPDAEPNIGRLTGTDLPACRHDVATDP